MYFEKYFIVLNFDNLILFLLSKNKLKRHTKKVNFFHHIYLQKTNFETELKI